jgi:hypothetical protein
MRKKKPKADRCYATTVIDGKMVYMQDMVMENILRRPLRFGERVEFINGDTLDCRDSNLRLVKRQN